MAKYRFGFVSNSSSSSFVVIHDNPLLDFVHGDKEISYPTHWKDRTIEIGPDNEDFKYCKTSFQWENEKTYNTLSKIAWATLQAYYAKNNEYFEMIRQAIIDVTEATDVVFNLDKINDWNSDWNIDHQSTIPEDKEQEIIFKDLDTLKKFLFHTRSYIQGGNDNE